MKFKPDDNYYLILQKVVNGQLNTPNLHFVAPDESIDEGCLKIISSPKIRYTKQVSRAGNLGQWVKNKGKVFCSRSPELKQNVLLPNGNIYVCCCDYGLEFNKGNLLEDRNTLNNTIDPTELCLKCEHARPLTQ